MSSEYAAHGGSPQRLDKYELHERLGHGGMAEVWKALDTQLHRYVAIKLLHPDLRHDPNFIARFQREAQLVASLKHPNIVQIYDFQIVQGRGNAGQSNASAYMVMEYIAGQTLAGYIARTSRQRQFPSAQVILHLFASISSAVDYAHQHGMLHRDIKPSNILLDKSNTTYNPMGEPILTDFGLVKLLGASTGSLSGSWLGTPLYIAPEQAQGYPGNERSDLYALGVILYELFTGALPFSGETPVAILQQHLHAQPTSPMLLNPAISPPLAMVILCCLAKDPAARFASASSLTEALAEALDLSVPEHMDTAVSSLDPTNEPTHVGGQLQASTEQTIKRSSLVGNGSMAGPISQQHTSVLPQTPVPSSSLPPTLENDYGQVGKPAELADSRAAALPSPVSQPKTLSPEIALPANTPVAVTSLLVPQPYETADRHTAERPAPTPSLPQQSSFNKVRKRYKGVLLALLALLILSSGIGVFFLLQYQRPGEAITSSTVVGYAYILSSGLLDERNSQGEADELEIDLQNIPAPAPGKSYYAWLLRDKIVKDNVGPVTFILLGTLSVHNGAVHFHYGGDQQHTNLFSIGSRLLITEEQAGNSPPQHPSTDHTTWRYYAELPQIPSAITLNHSALDFLKNLLYEARALKVLGIHGGMTIQLLRHTLKVWEFVNSARDSWEGKDFAFIHRQVIRTLDYIDGLSAIQLDVPPGTPLLADKQLVQIPLIDSAQFNAIRSYSRRINDQINGFVQSPGITPQMRQLAIQSDRALLSSVLPWLQQVRQDAKQLAHMTDTQLSSPAALSLLDDMAKNANYALNGRLDPATDEVQPGVVQVYYDIQHLATFTITPYK